MTAKIETYARPTWLYRYRSLRTDPETGRASPIRLQRELEAILNGSIYCPPYTQMNDPMEGFYRASRKVRNQIQYDRFTEDVRHEKLGLGIASLSETWDNELMWTHYADEFRGICVVYVVARLIDGLCDGTSLAKIAYGDRPYYLDLHGLRREDRARAILSTKSLKWSYEREWRLFAERSGPAQHGARSIPTVYLGMRMDPADRQIIRDTLGAAAIRLRDIEIDGYRVKRTHADESTDDLDR